MKGERHLWSVLNDKLEMLRASDQLPEAIRVEKARWSWRNAVSLRPILSWQRVTRSWRPCMKKNGDHAAARQHFIEAHKVLEQATPADQHAIFDSARRLARMCDELGQSEEAITWYERAIGAA